MKKLSAVIIFSAILGGISAYSSNLESLEFENFKQNIYKQLNKENQEFKKYKEEILKEFQEYKKIVQEEYNNYKKEVSKYWLNPEISTKKKFVEYSKDLKIKKVADFEKGRLRIEIRSAAKPSQQQIRKILKQFISEDKETAFHNDKLSQCIEKRLESKIKHLKKSKIEKKPLIADIILGNKKPTEKNIDITVKNLIKKSKIKKKKSKISGENVYSIEISLPKKGIFIKAKEYVPLAIKFSRRYSLRPEIILAIIHTESSFNPLARSPVPAYGLMQIVPQTAGKDATKLIYGRPYVLSPSYLYNDENNVLIGSTYFYILYYRYLKDIKNPLSRLFCSIAAYNTGAGNVARAFIGTTNIKRAIKKINSLTPEEVYTVLINNLPYAETKYYLKKVYIRIKLYQKFIHS